MASAPEHDPIAWTHRQHAIAATLSKQGRHEAAADLLRQVLTVNGRDLGAEHSETLTTRHSLANVLRALGQTAEAETEHHAVLAPRELDLMFVIGGVLAFAPVTTEEQSWFFGGYGDIDLDPERLAYYRCTRALVDLVDPAAQAADVRLSERERADAMSIVEGVLSPTGLATLALSSVGNAGHGRRP